MYRFYIVPQNIKLKNYFKIDYFYEFQIWLYLAGKTTDPWTYVYVHDWQCRTFYTQLTHSAVRPS